MESLLQCARDYADVWTSRERDFVSGVSSGDGIIRLAALQAAAGYFRVARNFPTFYDVRRGLPRLKPALDVLDQIEVTNLTERNALTAISRLRRDLGNAYGKADLLSAATKFLWLRRPDAVIIFDSQARAALGAPYGDYAVYLDLWHKHYGQHRMAISAACLELWRERPSTAGSIAGSTGPDVPEWFIRRIHDIYLWRAGSPSKGSPSRRDA
jgi:hypothetical protein